MLDQAVIKAVEEASGHSVFGPSSMPRIVLCPASVGECLKVPPKPQSIYAAHGSMLHDRVEQIEKLAMTVEQLHDDPELTIPDVSYVQDCVDWAEKMRRKHEGAEFVAVGIEVNVSLAPFGLPMVNGTSDHIVQSEFGIDVTDWKFGQGVPRYAKECFQAISYGGGSVGYSEDIDPNYPVRLHIVQPPLNIFDTWEITYGRLCQYIFEDISKAVELAHSDNPPFNPGLSQCRFCDASMTCEARHDSIQVAAQKVFLADAPISSVPPEKLSALMAKATAIEQYFKDARKYIASQIQAGYGANFPDFKMVAGRGSRAWVDPKAAEDYLYKLGFDDEHIYEKKFVSPAKAEKLDKELKKIPEFQKLWTKKEGKPNLVDKSHRGKALQYSPQEVFASDTNLLN